MANDPITAGLDIAGKVLDKFFTNKDDRAKAQERLEELKDDKELQKLLAQAEINKIEAASLNWFVAGWRPAIGWVGALALLYKFIVYPSMCWVITIFPSVHIPPSPNADELYPIILGMLGIGAMRSFDKAKGTDTK